MTPPGNGGLVFTAFLQERPRVILNFGRAMNLILASASPRRRELLEGAGLNFRVVPPREGSELPQAPKGAAGSELASLCALGKALQVAADLDQPALVIGADTVVVVDDQVLGKPADDREARWMLGLLSGREHQVITAVALVRAPGGERRVESELTRVVFRSITPAEIDAYIAGGEHADKAGAYGIQGRAALWTERVEGCYFNVVGLPLFRLGRMLKEAGMDPFLPAGEE